MRLIDADFLKEWVDEYLSVFKKYDKGTIKGFVDHAPTIEPKRGEWIVHKARTEVNDGFIDFFPTEYECSNCGLKQSMYFINSKPSNFCPNCGADMREREGE